MYCIMFGSALSAIRADLELQIGKLFLELYNRNKNQKDLKDAINTLNKSYTNMNKVHSSHWNVDPCIHYAAPWLIYAHVRNNDIDAATVVLKKVIKANKRVQKSYKKRCFYWCCNVSGRGNISGKGVSIIIRHLASLMGYTGRGFFWPLQYFEKNRVAGYDSQKIKAAWYQLVAHCYLSLVVEKLNVNGVTNVAGFAGFAGVAGFADVTNAFKKAVEHGLACPGGHLWYSDVDGRRDKDGNYINGTSPFASLCHIYNCHIDSNDDDEEEEEERKNKEQKDYVAVQKKKEKTLHDKICDQFDRATMVKLKNNYKQEQKWNQTKKCCTWPLMFAAIYLFGTVLFFNILCGVSGYKIMLGGGETTNHTDAVFSKMCRTTWSWGTEPM